MYNFGINNEDNMATAVEQLDEQKRKVDFDSYDISVKELVSLVSDGTIDIAPDYQRQFRWDEDRQSQLVESILLGIPIPNLFMATNSDGTWELIDGVQRLSSIIRYVGDENVRQKINLEGQLTLANLEKLDTFNGKTFQELPKPIQLSLLLKPLKITTLSDKSDLSVRFDLFERLNTGGISLTNQEIRSCVYRGKFNDFLKQCSDNIDFRTVVRLTEKQESDGTRDEFVLRFFAFYDKYEEFDHSVVDFLNEYMTASNKSFDYVLKEELFKKTFAALASIFPNGVHRAGRTKTPTNLYESVAVGAAKALNEVDQINSNTDWVNEDEIRGLTTGATNSRARVAGRIEFAKQKFIDAS